MAALTAYFDDSGTHKQSPVAIAAAWLSPLKDWEKFCTSWQRVLDKEKFECFHFSEFAASNPKSEFADWDDAKKRRVLYKLRNIIKKTVQCGFTVAVSKSDYDEAITGDIRQEAGEFHYTWAVRCVIGFIERWREQGNVREPTEYIFDRLTEGKAEIDLIFKGAESDSNSFHRYGIYAGCHSFRDKKQVLPLQASDLAAWSMYQKAHLDATGKAAPNYAVACFNDLVKGNFLQAGQAKRSQLAEWVRQELEWTRSGKKEVTPRILTNWV